MYSFVPGKDLEPSSRCRALSPFHTRPPPPPSSLRSPPSPGPLICFLSLTLVLPVLGILYNWESEGGVQSFVSGVFGGAGAGAHIGHVCHVGSSLPTSHSLSTQLASPPASGGQGTRGRSGTSREASGRRGGEGGRGGVEGIQGEAWGPGGGPGTFKDSNCPGALSVSSCG